MKFWLIAVFIPLIYLLVGCTPMPPTGQPQVTLPLPDRMEVNDCVSSIGSSVTIDEMRQDLLTQAKRQAVGSLFGEEIQALTVVENFTMTLDQIRSYAVGKVRLLNSPQYQSGENLGDVCISATFYVTAEDRQAFAPKTIEGSVCKSTDQIDRKDIRSITMEGAEIEALQKYDTRLRTAPVSELLQLLTNIRYTQDGFVQDTPTYCVTLQGDVMPVEISAFIEALNQDNLLNTPILVDSLEQVEGTTVPTSVPLILITDPPPPPSSMPTVEPLPAPIPTPTCSVEGVFRSVWQSNLGCPTMAEQPTSITVEPFERGYMMWVKATDRIYVLAQGEFWREYENPWRIDEDTFACNEARTIGYPAMGFGKIWCQEAKDLLGRPLDKEIPRDVGAWQIFADGRMFLGHDDLFLVLYTSGSWVAIK